MGILKLAFSDGVQVEGHRIVAEDAAQEANVAPETPETPEQVVVDESPARNEEALDSAVAAVILERIGAISASVEKLTAAVTGISATVAELKTKAFTDKDRRQLEGIGKSILLIAENMVEYVAALEGEKTTQPAPRTVVTGSTPLPPNVVPAPAVVTTQACSRPEPSPALQQDDDEDDDDAPIVASGPSCKEVNRGLIREMEVYHQGDGRIHPELRELLTALYAPEEDVNHWTVWQKAATVNLDRVQITELVKRIRQGQC